MRRIWQSTAIWLVLPLGGYLPAGAGLLPAVTAGEPARVASTGDAPANFNLPLNAAPIREFQSTELVRTISYPSDVNPSGPIRDPRSIPQTPIAQSPQIASAPRGVTPSQQGMMVPAMTTDINGTQYMLVPVPANMGNNQSMPIVVMPQAVSPQPQQPAATWSTPAQSPQYMAANVPRGNSVMLPNQQIQPQQQPRRESQMDLRPLTEQVGKMTGQGFRLAERNALFAAKDQFIQALRMAAQSLDGRDGSDRHLRGLTVAFNTLDEAEDFAPKGGTAIDALNLGEVVDSHRTPVLKQAPVDRMSSMEALQYYYQFAQQQFIQAVGELPASGDAFYGLGKVHSALTQESGPLTQLHAARAIVFQQTALAVNPQHDKAANELGVMLARHGQWSESKKALLHSLRNQPRAETWHNLSVVHQRLGENELAQRAQWEQQRLLAVAPGSQSGPASSVQWVDSQQFVQMQPGPANNTSAPQYRTQSPPATAAQPRATNWPPTSQRR